MQPGSRCAALTASRSASSTAAACSGCGSNLATVISGPSCSGIVLSSLCSQGVDLVARQAGLEQHLAGVLPQLRGGPVGRGPAPVDGQPQPRQLLRFLSDQDL